MATPAKTMRAWTLDAPGTPSSFYIKEVPTPTPAQGWVLIRVKAFGLNRSEHHTLTGACCPGSNSREQMTAIRAARLTQKEL
jgi:NADPH:quinone reductase-like Zn-dependent oxidoreductase